MTVSRLRVSVFADKVTETGGKLFHSPTLQEGKKFSVGPEKGL
jgi:hypothetical protein